MFVIGVAAESDADQSNVMLMSVMCDGNEV